MRLRCVALHRVIASQRMDSQYSQDLPSFLSRLCCLYCSERDQAIQQMAVNAPLLLLALKCVQRLTWMLKMLTSGPTVCDPSGISFWHKLRHITTDNSAIRLSWRRDELTQ